MKKILICCFSLSLVFLSGCNNQNSEEGYIYNIEQVSDLSIDNGHPIVDKQKLYLSNDKWKIEHNSNDREPFSKAIDLFDGKNTYAIAKVKNINLADKSIDYTTSQKQQQIYTTNPAYALLNWDTYNPDNLFTNFNKNIKPKEIGNTKSKYGYDCTQYEYNWKEYHFNVYYENTRKVCVNNNMAVSIQLKQIINSDSESNFSLELIKYKKAKLADKIFDVYSIKNLKFLPKSEK